MPLIPLVNISNTQAATFFGGNSRHYSAAARAEQRRRTELRRRPSSFCSVKYSRHFYQMWSSNGPSLLLEACLQNSRAILAPPPPPPASLSQPKKKINAFPSFQPAEKMPLGRERREPQARHPNDWRDQVRVYSSSSSPLKRMENVV